MREVETRAEIVHAPSIDAFRITPTPLDPAALAEQLASQQAGACVAFEGRVRDRNEGRAVRSLEYEAFAELAQREGERVLQEARGRFQILACGCVHRVGHLALGEVAVWAGVSAEHRGDAFDAARFIIDEVKKRVPIWKKEHYAEGESAWINAADPMMERKSQPI